MNAGAWVLVIAAAVTGVLALAGVVWTAATSIRVSKTAPYGEMVDQVRELMEWQKEAAPLIVRLERREALLISHVHDLRAWMAKGRKGVPPEPHPELADVLPPWEFHPDDGQPGDVTSQTGAF